MIDSSAPATVRISRGQSASASGQPSARLRRHRARTSRPTERDPYDIDEVTKVEVKLDSVPSTD